MRWAVQSVDADTMVVEPKSSDDRFDLREYLPLVAHAVAEKAAHVSGEDRHEALACAGMLGLLEATLTFPAAHEPSFGTHALRRIRLAVGEELAGVAWPQRAAAGNAVVAGHVRRVLPQGLQGAPSAAEAAACLRLRLPDVRALITEVAGTALTLDRLVLGTPDTGGSDQAGASPLASRQASYYADVASASARRATDPVTPDSVQVSDAPAVRRGA